MKKNILLMSSILIALFGVVIAVQDAFAVDPPHNGQNNISMTMTCDSCHYDATVSTPSWATQPTTTDNTFYNNLCTSCHNPVTMPGNNDYIVKTHSYSNTSGKYPPWTVECRVCHNPHYQDQVTGFTTDTSANLLSGTLPVNVSSAPGALQTVVAVSTTLTPSAWIDYMLVPDVRYPTKMYRIKANSTNQFTVIGPVNINYARAGATFAVRLGSMVASRLPVSGGTATVKFFTPDNTKPNSYASSTNPANVTGVCQVCHTQTKSFNRNPAGSPNQPSFIQEQPTIHPQVTGTTQVCTECHIHTEGFKGTCTSCHGSPPVDPATLIFKSATGIDVTSDSLGAGAHDRHVNGLGYNCTNCHSGGMLGGQAEGDNKINIGFNLLSSNLGGSYDGTSGRTYYTYASGTGSPTSVTAGGTRACTNLYCHSTGQSLNGASATPVYASPTWGNPGSGACGTCHQTTLITTGSHSVHRNAASAGCDDCHTGAAADGSSYASANHVNRSIEVSNTYSAFGPLGNGYGTCSAAACHASPYGISTVVTPTWGAAAGCEACHSIAIGSTGPATGGHALHNSTNCTLCHNAGTTSTNAPSTGHANGNIDVANVGYPATVAKHAAGSGYTTCSAASCHANVYGAGTSTTPVWGSTGNGCSACHSTPIAATGPNTGGHGLHAETNCTLCHNAGTTSTSVPSTEHANGFIDTANVGYLDNKGKGTAFTTCSAASCHANVYGAGTSTTPVWGSTGNGCSACHSTPIAATGPNTGSHALHNSTNCTLCHNAGTTSTSVPSTEHANGFIDTANVGYLDNKGKGTAFRTCSAASCHANVYGVGTTPTPTWGTTGNGCSACHSVPIGANGPATGSHVLHATAAGTVCTTCHNAGTTSTTVPSTEHANGFIDTANVNYTDNKAKGSAFVSCATTNCHGTASPTWGANTTNAQCVKCHGVAGTSTASYIGNPDQAAPGYVAAGRDTSGNNGNPTSGGVSPDAQVGAHDTHLRGLGGYKTNGIVCTDCHQSVVSIATTSHMNGATTFAWSSLATNSGALTPSYASGVCSNIACHGMSTNIVNRGTDTTPLWTDGAYITSVASALTSCGVCHQSPPPKYRDGSTDHPAVALAANACNACHQHTGNGGAHIDGILQATGGNCSSCHDYDLDANGDWGKMPKAVEGWGAHALHISHLKAVSGVTLSATGDNFNTASYNAVCGVCHTRNSGNHDMGGVVNLRTINFGEGAAAVAFSTSGTLTYNGVTGVSSATTQKICSNVSCHFQPAPVWQGL